MVQNLTDKNSGHFLEKKFRDNPGDSRPSDKPSLLRLRDCSHIEDDALEWGKVVKFGKNNYQNENTEYLNKLIGIVLLLARQGLPFRGHREHSNSKNRGNFLEFAEFLAQNYSVFKTNFNKSINHTSPDFQNEIIELSAKAVTNVIVEKVKACGFFSLMVDEARCFKEEQLSITIRFAVGVEVEVHFLGFIDCSVSRDASSLQKIILEFLKIRNLENIPIVGQSYDGANVMSGYKNGLQMKIKESNPQAVFIHCLAHKLNLVIEFPSFAFNTKGCELGERNPIDARPFAVYHCTVPRRTVQWSKGRRKLERNMLKTGFCIYQHI
ncbi:zinc finger MYM-type protein 1-like [Haematobia irritans]|uniref:zinc finger MYM-type protein 1-like n=1 Tax=Haematobia irritans TaxID=7368 RepID=UPI003F505329